MKSLLEKDDIPLYEGINGTSDEHLISFINDRKKLSNGLSWYDNREVKFAFEELSRRRTERQTKSLIRAAWITLAVALITLIVTMIEVCK
jgi:hypothetical protein